MSYNRNRSMAYIDNIVEALNKGGMLDCEGIVEVIWNDATEEQIARKVSAPRIATLRNEDYAIKQLRQEVRRTLNSHFNNLHEESYQIHRATPIGSPEHFWVSEIQDTTLTRVPPTEPVRAPIAEYTNPFDSLTSMAICRDRHSNINHSLDGILAALQEA